MQRHKQQPKGRHIFPINSHTGQCERNVWVCFFCFLSTYLHMPTLLPFSQLVVYCTAVVVVVVVPFSARSGLTHTLLMMNVSSVDTQPVKDPRGKSRGIDCFSYLVWRTGTVCPRLLGSTTNHNWFANVMNANSYRSTIDKAATQNLAATQPDHCNSAGHKR